MCGIAGSVSLHGAPAMAIEGLNAMCQTLVHRGPDDEGQEIASGVALGMRRLSIIDLAGGRQPLYNEDRSVRVVFNGEIYNFRELRAELEQAGHRFTTHTDGEVIAHLWEEHGIDFPLRLNGMFAIALHDLARRRFVLVRDPLGIKPLFWTRTATHLVFGSEIKAILASGLVERTLNVDGLGQFLAWEYVPGPATLFDGIQKLDAGGCLELDLDSGGQRLGTWWDVPAVAPQDKPLSPREWEDAVDAAIRRAVRRQLISDVPLGAFLSGGVDSSLVVACMGQARTFAIGFDDPSYNELEWSRRVARHLEVSHRSEVIQPQLGDHSDQLMRYMDDPIGDFSIFPTYLVSRLARREVTVALTGDGGDECFGGYETYVADRAARAWTRVPSPLRRPIERVVGAIPPRPAKKGLLNKARRFVEGLSRDADLGHARWRVFLSDEERLELFTKEALEQMSTSVEQHIAELRRRAGPRDAVDRALYVDLKSYLVDNCLVKVDRMSMAVSLEARVPLLDREIVELAFRVPSGLKVHGGSTKVLLKRVASRHVPRRCVYRPKEGFSIPIKHWLKKELRPLMEDLLNPSRLAQERLFNIATVERLKREHLAGRANHSHVLWSLIVFQDWRRRWAT